MNQNPPSDPLVAALQAALPGVRPVTIPGKVALALRNHQPVQLPVVDTTAEAKFAQSGLYGLYGGREWQITLPRGDPPLLSLNAHMRWAPPGHESERRIPWVMYGALPGKLSMSHLPLGPRADLATAERELQGATEPVGKSPLGRSLVSAASYPGAATELRSEFWVEAFRKWESIVGPP